MVTSRNLHGRGTRFVNSHLEAGGVLARAVLDGRGPVTSAVAPLPVELDLATLPNLDHGGVISLSASIAWLVPELRRQHQEDSQYLLIVEDSWARPSDVLDNDGMYRLRLAEEDCVVYTLTSDQINELSLKILFRGVISFFFTGFVVESSELLARPVGAVSATDLTQHVKEVFASAFDGDGLILSDWR